MVEIDNLIDKFSNEDSWNCDKSIYYYNILYYYKKKALEKYKIGVALDQHYKYLEVMKTIRSNMNKSAYFYFISLDENKIKISLDNINIYKFFIKIPDKILRIIIITHTLDYNSNYNNYKLVIHNNSKCNKEEINLLYNKVISSVNFIK
jgi:hypothetical protein